MRITNAGIAALVAAAGIWIGFSGELAMAAKSAKPAAKTSVAAADRPIVLSKFKKHRAHAVKKSRTAQTKNARKSASKSSARTIAKKSPEKRLPVEKKAVADTSKKAATDTGKSELPATVINARAQALADDQARNIAALDSTDVTIVDGVQLAAADQLTDADRAATDDAVSQNSAAAPPPPAISQPSPAPSGKIIRAVPSGEKQVVKADDRDPWSETSLIGKIFIAFGSLLTLASAARLMIA